jgi:hypothetical protein
MGDYAIIFNDYVVYMTAFYWANLFESIDRQK